MKHKYIIDKIATHRGTLTKTSFCPEGMKCMDNVGNIPALYVLPPRMLAALVTFMTVSMQKGAATARQ